MAADDTSFPINIDTTQANKAIDALTKRIDAMGKDTAKSVKRAADDVGSGVKSMGDRFKELGDRIDSIGSKINIGAAIAGTVVALNKFGNAIGSTIEKAREKEDALAMVRQSMARTGEFSEANAKRVQEFADSLEETTGLADDTALKLFSMAKGFGVSNDAAMKMVQAANQLSAVTGKGLEDSLRQLGGTLTGSTDKLEKMIPALGGVSESALKAGKAIDIVLAQFDGSAEAKMLTFGGSVSKASAAFEDLEVAIGSLFTQNAAVTAVVNAMGQAFKVMTGFVEQNQDSFKEFIARGLRSVVSIMPAILRALDGLASVIDVMLMPIKLAGSAMDTLIDTIFKGISPIDAMTNVMLELADALLLILNFVTSIPTGVLSMLPGSAGKFFEEMDASRLEGFQKALDKIRKTQEDIANRSVGTIAYAEGSPAAAAQDAAAKANPLVGLERIFQGLTTTLDDLLSKPAPALTPQAPTPQNGQPAAQAPAPAGEGAKVAGQFDFGPVVNSLLRFPDMLESAGASFLKNISGGEAGARKFVGEFGSGIATMFGASGPVAGGIGAAIEMLGQDPETFGKMIDGFVEGIPRIIDNIIENIPTLVIAIAENSGEIITALVAASPRIVIALAQAMPEVAMALLEELVGGLDFQGGKFETATNNAADAITGSGEKMKAAAATFNDKINAAGLKFSESIRNGIGEFGLAIANIGKSFGGAISNAFQQSIGAMIDAIKDALSFDVGGGGGNPGRVPFRKKPTASNPLGLAAGGEFEVPPGYPNDSFPMYVQSGEKVRVTPANQMGSDISDGAMLLLAQLVELVKAGAMGGGGTTVSIDGTAIADVQTDLARRNARVR